MVRYKNLYLLFICFVSICTHISAVEKPDIFISYNCQDKTYYERQAFPIILTLYSSNPDIAYANKSSNLILKKGSFETIKRIEPIGNAYKTTLNGKSYYCFPLEEYLVTLDEKGSYEFLKRNYEIGISYPVIVNDPFWGRIRSSEIMNYVIDVNKCNFKIKSLPNPPVDFNFSGSIGDFKVETIVPKGDIIINEEATAYIIIRGKGTIASKSLPEYKEAFKGNLKLKSISESRNEIFENGEVISELRLECIFIPTSSENVEIGKVKYDFFNPEKEKYMTIESPIVKINVKSSVIKRESISI